MLGIFAANFSHILLYWFQVWVLLFSLISFLASACGDYNSFIWLLQLLLLETFFNVFNCSLFLENLPFLASCWRRVSRYYILIGSIFLTYSDTLWPFTPCPSQTPMNQRFLIFVKSLITKNWSWLTFPGLLGTKPVRDFAAWITMWSSKFKSINSFYLFSDLSPDWSNDYLVLLW